MPKRKLLITAATAGARPAIDEGDKEKKDPLARIKAMGGVQPLALSIPELVALSGIGRTSIYAAIEAGRLSIRKVGRRTVVPHGEAMRFIAGESAGVAA